MAMDIDVGSSGEPLRIPLCPGARKLLLPDDEPYVEVPLDPELERRADELMRRVGAVFFPGGSICPYSEEQLEKIAAAVGLSAGELSQGWIILLVHFGKHYLQQRRERSAESWKAKRKRFEELVLTLDCLRQQMEGMRDDYPNGFIGLDRFGREDGAVPLPSFCESMEIYLDHAKKFYWSHPGPGRPKDDVTPIFVLALARLYVDLKGRWPTRRHNPITGKDCGEFRDFVCAALDPIDPARCRHGIDDVIRHVLKHADPDERIGFRASWRRLLWEILHVHGVNFIPLEPSGPAV